MTDLPAPAPETLQPLSGLDALFLHLETPEMPMHVGSLMLLELPAGYAGDFTADVRALIGTRLHLAPAFTRRLATMPLGFANPVWTRAGHVDLERHIRRETLPRPGTPAQLEARVARLHAQRLDRSRPLWELVIIDGLGGDYAGHVACYAKVHHSAVDGQAGIALARALLDTGPQPRAFTPPPAPPGRDPGVAELVGAAAGTTLAQLHKLRQLLPAAAREGAQAIAQAVTAAAPRVPDLRAGLQSVRTLLPARTRLNHAIGRERTFATASFDLAALKATARALDVTLNDLVLAVCSGALRRWLGAHGGVPPTTLYAGVPFTLRAEGDAAAANQVSMMRAALATELADPRARLAAIHASTSRGKRIAGGLRDFVPTDYPTLGTPWLLSALATLTRTPLAGLVPALVNVAISNVPGPPAPLFMAGARVVHYWPVSIVIHGVALNITVTSYVERMEFGLTACARAVPDLASFKRHLEAAYDEYAGLVVAAIAPHAPAKKRPERRTPHATAPKAARAASKRGAPRKRASRSA